MQTINLLKLKTPKVHKNKKLDNTNFSNFTHIDYQIFLHLVNKIGEAYAEDKYLKLEQLQREHTLSVQEFSKILNVPIIDCYEVLKQTVAKLMKTDVKVNQKELKEIWRINVCSSAEYNEKEGYITVIFTSDIMPCLVNIKQKIDLYNLKEMSNFDGLNLMRLK